MADHVWRHDGETNWKAQNFVGVACWALGIPPAWRDADGYDREVAAAAYDPTDGHVAWVECRQQWLRSDHLDIEYRLKARVGGRLAIDWVVETYNPYSGCAVGYMAWHGERLVMVYREKHHTYACSATAEEEVRLVQAADNWRVVGLALEFSLWRSAQVERLSLPGLEPLPPLSEEEARETGLLSPS
jgi:hypothetical protein